MVPLLRKSHSEHFAVCTLTTMKSVPLAEQFCTLWGVCGYEVLRRCLCGVLGAGALRCTRISALLLTVAAAAGVRGGAVSPVAGVGVVGRGILFLFFCARVLLLLWWW